MTIWVLGWSYYDGSGSGVVQAYRSETLARAQLKLMEEHSDKRWTLHSVELVPGYEDRCLFDGNVRRIADAVLADMLPYGY